MVAISVPKGTVPWRPSNATEADIFISNVCKTCKHWMLSRKSGFYHCKIMDKTFFLGLDDKRYPKHFVMDEDGTNQRCLGYARR
jgi:hypothetical protein